MTGSSVRAVPPAARSSSGVVAWIKEKDPGRLAVKRSVRAAVVMPSAFAFSHLLFSNPQIDLFAAFGSFALLLLVDVPGPPRTKVISYAGLFVLGSCFVALGTAVSTNKAAAVAVMAVVGFGVLFTGIVSPQAASASTAVLLTFVLPVAVAQPASAIAPRLVGWLIAGVASIPACLLVWPTPWHDDLRRRLAAAMSAVGRVAELHSTANGSVGPARLAMESELSQLAEQFRGTPYPPTGTAAGAVALAKLVGRVEWVASSAVLVGDEASSDHQPEVRAVIGSVAETLQRSASLVCDGDGHPVDDPELVLAVQESTRQLDRLVTDDLDAEVSMLIDPGPGGGRAVVDDGTAAGGQHDQRADRSPMDASFHARALGIATEMVADAALEAAGAQPVGDRRLSPSTLSGIPLQTRLVSYLSLRSVWFRNAVRGAAGLALAVAVVEITDVEHGFWVVLGTLSVLRSNALGTGATAVRAIGGTAIGVVVGSAIMIGVAGDSALLWALLPVAVLVSGVAPSMVSFAAGQAGFTVVVVILFNIIDPTGWRVGLTRIEDVAIGCGVSIVVGLLFWPRGATAALGQALSDAFVRSSGYLADAVDRLTTFTGEVDTDPGQRASHRAYLRLDDAFRQLLTERGAKVVPVETVANLLTGSNRIRLAAYTLTTLPAPAPGADPDHPELESVAVAGAVLRDSYASSHRWYEEFAEVLADRRDTLDPPPVQDGTLEDVLRTALEDARAHRRSDRLRTMLQMFWADDLLEAQRRVQADLAGAADLFVRRRHKTLA
jgi:uncharacterized membrane protein YccC